MKLFDVIITYVVNDKVVTKTIADVYDKYQCGSNDFTRFFTGNTCFKIRTCQIITLDEFNFREIGDEDE